MTCLLILSAAVLAVDALLFLPLGLSARYAGGRISLVLRAGPVRIRLLPRKGGRRAAERTARDAGGVLEQVPPDVLRLAAEQLPAAWRRLRRRVRMDLVRLRYTAGGADPYAAAMAYARAGVAMEGLERLCAGHVVRTDLRAEADLSGGGTAVEAAVAVTARLGTVLGAALCFGMGFLREYFRYRRKAETEG